MINYKLIAPDFELSRYQKNFCEAIVGNRNHISMEATAGSSKTTSALMALKLIPKFQRTIFLSFSNQIVKELKEKVPPHVKAATLHSLGYSFVNAYYPGIKVVQDKYVNLALDHYKTKKKEIFKKAYQIQDISQYIRMTLTKLDMDAVEQMCDNYDLDFSEETINIAIQLIRNDDYPRMMDFADMIFLPAVKEDMVQETFHNVFLDEAQDLNNAQIQFAQNILKNPNGRLISLGDSWQSIYGFAGSDINSFKKLKSIEGTVELPLSISYRCARAIVEEAQKICPIIEAAPNAKEGIVRWGEYDEVKEGDFVLCRNNAPLVDLYYRLIEKGIKAKIIGKEIEKGITEIAELCMSPTKSGFMDNLSDRLDYITQELVLRGYSSPQKHIRYSNFSDKMDLLEIICDKVRSTAEIIPTIKGLFVEEGEGVQLMTLHKSKGLENDRVFIMKFYKGKQLIPSQYAILDWQLQQESNLEFVGITRAKTELVYFNLYEK